MSEVTHMAGEDGVMPCCGKTPWEADMTDRITISTDLVTCTGQKPEPYTPTTEQVRHHWIGSLIDEFPPLRARAEFDRWLAEVKAQERERIVKMLEAEMPPCDGHNAHYCGRECDVTSLIALIKGETE